MSKTLIAIQNPYWDEAAPLVVPPPGLDGFERIEFQQAQYHHRLRFVTRYAWAIPDPASIAFVAQHLGGRAVEVGAGTGYWASLLAQSGIDIVAYDAAPPDREENRFFGTIDERGRVHHALVKTWHPVDFGGPDILRDAADRSLFLCWPPLASPMAHQCLQHYQGNRLVYIGEQQYGCTGNSAFFEELDLHWEERASHRIMQWFGLNDFVVVYDRRESGERRC